MTLKIEWVDWVDGKRYEVACGNPEPLSIQANIAALSQRLWKAESTLDEIRRWTQRGHYPPGATGSDWQRGFLAARYEVRHLLDDGGE